MEPIKGGGSAPSVGSIKVRMEVLFGDESEGLTVDRLNRSGSELSMDGDRQDLGWTAFDLAPQLGVAASYRDDKKAEGLEDPQDLPG